MSVTATARVNKYGAKCARCTGWVPAGEGVLLGARGMYRVEHDGECPPATPRTASAVPELGYYVRKDGAAIKVVESKSNAGRRYGLVFTPREGRRPTWAYVRGAGISVADLTPMTARDAAQLGLSCGHCIACCAPLGGETLSAHVSALLGYGETCAHNNGWEYPRGVAAQRDFIAGPR